MIKFLKRLALVLLLATLNACVSNPSMSAGGDYFPGGSQFYSYGVSQSKENFANVERAQSNYGLYTTERAWIDVRPMRAPSSMNMLQAYYPLHVRWKLKDGREFILENIDVRSAMREYFKTHTLEMPYQREKRPWVSGDYDPTFVHEIQGDQVVLKWLIRNNRTPLERRAKELPKIEYEEYIVTAIKGTPTSGIDFDQHWEFKK
jgi:hypothetical protein